MPGREKSIQSMKIVLIADADPSQFVQPGSGSETADETGIGVYIGRNIW